MHTLFDPLKIGDLTVPNRIFMAPLTRNRSTGPGRVPNAMKRNYYAQRACAGLIISEATSAAPMWVGYPHTPGVAARKGSIETLCAARPKEPIVDLWGRGQAAQGAGRAERGGSGATPRSRAGPQVKAALSVAYGAGLRVSEVANPTLTAST
jgi:2,4-dienoyl-CoA reductase-like NADH-dependent reductase (Old Yellow Enzyme family)